MKHLGIAIFASSICFLASGAAPEIREPQAKDKMVAPRAPHVQGSVVNDAASPLEPSPLDIGAIFPIPEPLGPSNRRGGVVLSEIMFHPAARQDGRNAQFVEVFNTFDWPQDLSGWRLSGEVDYVFPTNTVLPARGFLVAAPAPGDFKAAYGGVNALGGFDALPKDQGRLRLRNPNGGIVFEVEYGDKFPIPPAAAEAGHSLVLARPSYGEGQAEAWASSERVGGSPGAFEPERDPAYRTVVINEVFANPDASQTDFVELFNYGSQPVNLDGCMLTDDPAKDRLVLPANTVIPAMGFVVFDRTQLGFGLSARGESVFLFTPDRSRVIDAFRYGAQALGVSIGRCPDGAPVFSELSRPTPGTTNSSRLARDIAINEIMYAPIGGDPDDEYVELYNRGAAAVDLGGWRFMEGIDFTFAPGTVISVGGYLVVARNKERLLANYGQLNTTNTVGNYQGSLANKGERLALSMPQPRIATQANGQTVTNWDYVEVNAVCWRAGGRWPNLAHGGGSSLELIDPRADNRFAANWAASDETAKSEWTTISATGALDNGSSFFPPNQLQILMLGEGECLIDNVAVFQAGGSNLIANPKFTTGLTGWVAQGSHSGSLLEEKTGVDGDACLHIRATARGDTGANRIRAALSTTVKSNATLQAQARWLGGWPEVLLRLRDNSLEAAGRLKLPHNLGTPGLINSRRVVNAGPAIADVVHDPVLPSAGQPVTVRARIDDPDGLTNLFLYYRLDPNTNYTRVAMTCRGAGFYSATVSGQAAGAMVAFHLEAGDGQSPSAVSRFPNDAPRRECLIRFGEVQPPGGFGTYRLWLTDGTVTTWTKREPLSNEPLDGTFVYGSSRVAYNVGALNAGSPFTSNDKLSPMKSHSGFVILFPEDDLCLNTTDFTLDHGRDYTWQQEHVALWMFDRLGVHGGYRRFIHLYINGVAKGEMNVQGWNYGTLFEDCQQPNGDVIQEVYGNDTEGDLYKIDDWFEFDDAAKSFMNVDATLGLFTTAGNVKKTARYRWNWRKRAVSGSANDYASLFELVDAINPKDRKNFTAAEFATLEQLVDLDQWVRVLATERIAGNTDSYGFMRGKNMYAYKPRNGQWILWPWDVDAISFYSSVAFFDPVVIPPTDTALSRLLKHPKVRRLYLQALLDAVEGPMVAEAVSSIMSGVETALKANGANPASTSNTKKQIAQNRASIINLLKPFNVSFAIANNRGQDFSTNSGIIALTGAAPLTACRILINGIERPLTWTSPTAWSVPIELQAGRNVFTVSGLDRQGALVPGAQVTITIESTAGAELKITRSEYQITQGFAVQWQAVVGGRYQLQSTSRMLDAQWIDVGEPVTATDTTAAQIDPSPDARERFYRIKKL